MATQSYFANGGGVGCGKKKKNFQSSSWRVKNENESSNESEASDPDYDELETVTSNPNLLLAKLEKKELRGIKLAAKEIAKRGKDRLIGPYLTSFTPIHLTTGIAMIAEYLTPRAAELVSRPCCPDSLDIRTPFDLIRNMLTLIDENGSLISPPQSSWNSKGKIIDEVLAKALLEAAMVFRKCIEKDPDNVDHWSWYVATLLGALCIAFGSSYVTSRIQKNVKVEHEQMEQEQRGRPQLECFHEIRNNSAVALRDFVTFTQRHNCPMFHLAASSMLEWKKASLLLHRPQSFSSTNSGLGLEFKRLYAYHTYHWAVKVCSRTYIAKVQQLCELNHLPRDALLDILAGAIEHNPCDRKGWARLVEALGAVGSKGNDSRCLHTNSVQSEKGCSWWGEYRVAEWEDQFFYAPKSNAKAVKSEFVSLVSAAVESTSLSNMSRSQIFQQKAKEEGANNSLPCPKECMSWIWNPLEDTDDVDYDLDGFIDDVLFPENTSTIELHSQNELLLDPEIQKRLSSNPSCEALCMKIVVACHLMGIWHPFVCNSIWRLAVKLWQSKQAKYQNGRAKRSGYDDGLAWLSMYGLDISLYLQCRLRRSLP